MSSPQMALVIDADGKTALVEVDRLEKKFGKLSARAQTTHDKVKARFRGMHDSAKKFIGTGVSRALKVARFALIALAIASVVVGAKFEQSMANVQSVAGATEQELVSLSNTARYWGERTAFSANEAADAMYSLASAGQTAIQIQRSVGGVLLYAGATATDLGSAAEATVQALKMFNMEARETDRVVNVMAAGISASMLNSGRLKEALAQVGATAHATGMDLEHTVSALGTLHNAGQLGSLAGTRLKRVLVELASPNATLRDLLGDVSYTGNNLAEVMDHLRQKGADVSDVFGAFGKISGPAVLSLMSAGSVAMEEMTSKVTGTQKAMEMYEIQMNTVQSQFKIMKSAIQENMVAAFMSLKTVLRSGLSFAIEKIKEIKPIIVGIVTTVSDWIMSNQETIVSIAKISAAVFGVLAAWSLLTNPITWIAAAVAALTVVWVKWGDQIKAKVTEVVRRVIDFGLDFIKAHRTAIDTTLGLFKGMVNGIIGYNVFLALNFWDLGRTIIKALKGPLKWVLDRFQGLMDFAGPVLKKLGIAFGKTFEEMTAEIEAPVDEQKNIFARAQDAIAENARIAFGTDYVGAVVSGVGKAVDYGVEKLEDLKKATKDAASAGAGSAAMDYSQNDVPAPWDPEALYQSMNANLDRIQKLQEQKAQEAFANIADMDKAAKIETVGFAAQHTQEWLDAKTALIEENLQHELAFSAKNEADKAELGVKAAADTAQAQMEWQDAVLSHYMANNQLKMAGLFALEAAYNTFFDTILDKEMTGKERREAMWESMKRSFIRNTSEMLKAWLVMQMQNLILSEAAKAAADKKGKVAAAKAGAREAYKSLAGVPIIGPILGAAAAASAFAFLMAFHQGGWTGRGNGQGEFLARMVPDEYVVKPSSARSIGGQNLDYMNTYGRIPPSQTNVISLSFNVSGGGVDEEALREAVEDEVIPIIQRAVKSGVANLGAA